MDEKTQNKTHYNHISKQRDQENITKASKEKEQFYTKHKCQNGTGFLNSSTKVKDSKPISSKF